MNQKQGKNTPKPHNKGQSQGRVTKDNPLNLQAKNDITNTKKEIGKWCEFHKSPTHNKSECCAKHSLVFELKPSKSNACSDSESWLEKGNDKGKQNIYGEPSATVSTTKVQNTELKDLEEGECLFYW